MHGRALDFSTGRSLQVNRGILATNGHLHPAFIETLAHIPFCGAQAD
jgi:hypothetical protein